MRFLVGAFLALISLVSSGHPLTEAQALRDFEEMLNTSKNQAAVATLTADFEYLKANGVLPADTVLLVLNSRSLGSAWPNRVLGLSDALARQPRYIRMLVIAHEASHLRHEDSEEVRRFVESAVSPFATGSELRAQVEAIMPILSRDSRAKELRADKEAYLALKKLGFDVDWAFLKFFTENALPASQWHPSSQERLAALKNK